MNILVIDVGTSSMRGILFDRQAVELQKHQIFYSPDYINDQQVEQDPIIWKNALIEICRVIRTSTANSIDALAITSQRSSVLRLDHNNEPIGPAIMWQDKRTVAACAELSAYNDIFIKKTGSRVNPVYSASKINWFRKYQPDIDGRTSKYVVIPDYLTYIMTGSLVTDHTYGSRSLLMNIRQMAWDDDLLALWEVPRTKLLDLVPPGSKTGSVYSEFSRATGLAEGTPVYTAGGDQQCSAIGQGVIEQGSAQITAGSGAFILSACDQFPDDFKGDIILGASAIAGRYVLESSILTCSSAFNWYGREFYPETSHGDFSKIDQAISDAMHHDHRLIVLPFFQGRGTPDWNSTATASFHNVSLSTTRGDFALALLEGIGYEINENLRVASQYLHGLDQIAISGGLTKNPVFCQIVSDITNFNLPRYASAETTAIGAWIIASVATGLHRTVPEAFKATGQTRQTQHYQPVNADRYLSLKSEYATLYKKLY
ncbi:MAG TPA: hypothetical protein DCM45_06495 [Clostridiales bacterium]|nr:hypothetical protein [Clostridiales bacterium]